MFSKIAGFFKFIFGLFGKGPGPISSDGPKVMTTWVETVGGKKYKVTSYSDGTTKKEPYDASDPSDIDGFIDGLGG